MWMALAKEHELCFAVDTAVIFGEDYVAPIVAKLLNG
jgi:hypothetical protein